MLRNFIRGWRSQQPTRLNWAGRFGNALLLIDIVAIAAVIVWVLVT